MPWRPLPRVAFAVAVYPFSPERPADLPLDLGDELYIIEEGGKDGAWLRGYLVASPSLLSGLTITKGQTLEARVYTGVFPRSCVEIREYIGGEAESLRTSSQIELVPNGATPAHNEGGASYSPFDLGNTVSDTQRQMSTQPSTSTESQWAQHTNGTSSSPRRSPSTEAHGRESSITGPITPISLTPRNPRGSRPPAPVPMLKIGDETPTHPDEPLIDEIASCLREWHSANLHELLLSREYGKLGKLTRLMNRLDTARRQLLHGVLTSHEKEELHERIVWDMVKGNRLVNNEIIIRDPKQRGRLLTARDYIFDVAKLTTEMALLDHPIKPQQEIVNLHHLLVEVSGIVNNAGSRPNLLMTIYRKVPGENPQRLTESFLGDYHHNDKDRPERQKTLFAELTSMDVGELSGSDAELFLVIRVQITCEIKIAPPSPSRIGPGTGKATVVSEAMSNSADNTHREPVFGGRSTRRSLLWGSSRLGNTRNKASVPARIEENVSEHSLSSSEHEKRPSTARTDSTVQPPSSLTQNQGPKHLAKRDIGVAVLRLKNVLSQKSSRQETVTVWSPSDSGPRNPDQEDWSPIIPEIMPSLTGKFEECVVVTQIQLRLHSFVSPDVDELIRVTPSALLNVHKTPKIGFPGAPTHPRSDIYITIAEPNLPDHANFAHPHKGLVHLPQSMDMQNLQLTLEVRKENGERVEGCIFPTSNSGPITAWRTTAIRRGTAWRQTIKLVIPSQDVPKCHLIMSIADAPNFPFALAWMPLWSNGAFTQDGRHLPLLYIYDKITSRQDNGRGAYLDMPWNSYPLPGMQKYPNYSGNPATVGIETFLCSTELTQDQVLLGIINWKLHSLEQLSVLLRQLSFVPDIELVKLGKEVLQANFAILSDKAGQDDFEDLVLSNLVTILATSRDRRFNKEPVIERYIDTTFEFPQVAVPLLRSLQRLFAHTTDYQNSRHLNSTIKCGKLLMRVIVRSRIQHFEKEASLGIGNGNIANEGFEQEIRKTFAAFCGLVRNSSPALIGSKVLLMQNITSWMVVLRGCVAKDILSSVGWQFIDSTADVQGKMQLHRLALIQDYCRAVELARDTSAAEKYDLEPTNEKIKDWIAPYWGATTEVNEQYRDQVRLCVSIVTLRRGGYGKQTTHYNTKLLDSFICLRDAGYTHKNTLSFLFPQTYPFPSKALQLENPVDEALIEIASALFGFRDQVLETHIWTPERVMVVMDVMRSICVGHAFPPSWLTLALFTQRGMLFATQKFFYYLKEHMLPRPEQADQFRTDVWKSLFIMLLTIVSCDNLALETFPEQKRRAVWKISGDVRELGAGLLARCWNAIGWETDEEEKQQYGLDRLGGYQVQYVPSLVAPMVELSLSVHGGLRATAVQILQSMIISEWTLNQDLSVIQHEMVSCFDYLLKNKNVAEVAQQKLFIMELMDLFEPLAETAENDLWEAFKDLISVVEDLLDLLIVVHSPDTSDAFRTMNTLRLMDFLRDMQKEDIFISYVHQLADAEAQVRCFKEAGLALRLHADLYDWNPNKLAEELSSPHFPVQSYFERKESLYFEMIKHFEEGAAYSCALECYRELADQYEHTSFDFSKLARTQRSMAKIYELIARGDGPVPRYFKVVYKGLGFSANLRDKQYIFEGNGSERLIAFTDRLQREHPSAQIVNPGDSTDGEGGQYLQVTAVTPYRDLKHPLYQRSKVGFATKEYVLSMSPVNFAVTTKRHSPRTGVRDQWVEKSVYTTAEVFPTILRRSEIIAEEVLPLSPIQTAIERTVRKSSELWILEKRIRDGDETSNYSLMDAIRTSVDPHSSTSVAQYRDMLPKPHNNAEDEDMPRRAADPMQVALQIALLDFTSTLRHCLNSFSRALSLTEHKKLQGQLQSTFAPELAALSPAHGPDSKTPLFADPAFQLMPPTPKAPGFSIDSSHPEAQDLVPSSTTRARPALNSEARTPSRGKRLSALLRRKPSTANSGDIGVNGATSHPGSGHTYPARLISSAVTNSSSNVNEPAAAAYGNGPLSPDFMSTKSGSHKGSKHNNQTTYGQHPPLTASSFPSPNAELADDVGGPVYTAITSAKDANGSTSDSMRRPPTSHSNGTATSQRLAKLRRRLSAKQLGGEGVGSPHRWGEGDAFGVRVEVIQ